MLYFLLHTRLLQVCRSEQTVLTMMVSQFAYFLYDFECLRPVNRTITQEVNSYSFLCY